MRSTAEVCGAPGTTAKLAAPFGTTGSVHGNSYEDERDDDKQHSDDDVHGYSSLKD